MEGISKAGGKKNTKLQKEMKEKLPPEITVDIVLYKKVFLRDVEMIRESAHKKGWMVKVGQENYLKNGNNI